MEKFTLLKPIESTHLEKFSRIIVSLTYENFLSESGKLSGGLFYKILRPIIFTVLITIFIQILRFKGDLSNFVAFYFGFMFFFYILDLVSRSSFLNAKESILNLPQVSHFSIILAELCASLIYFIPQILIGISFIEVFQIKVNYFDVIKLAACSVAVGGIYFINMSLILYRNNVLVQFHDFFARALLFVSAVFYPLNFIPESYHFFFFFNPIVHLMEATRSIFEIYNPYFFSWPYIYGFILIGGIIFPSLYLAKIIILEQKSKWKL